MPAKSQAQQQLFALALSVKRGNKPRTDVSDEVLDIVDSMSEEDIKDYAKTSPKGLPKRVKQEGSVDEDRDYKSEYENYQSKPEQKKRRAQRNAARRKMERMGKAKKGDGKDVHHRNRKTSDNSAANLAVTPKSKNRSINDMKLTTENLDFHKLKKSGKVDGPHNFMGMSGHYWLKGDDKNTFVIFKYNGDKYGIVYISGRRVSDKVIKKLNFKEEDSYTAGVEVYSHKSGNYQPVWIDGKDFVKIMGELNKGYSAFASDFAEFYKDRMADGKITKSGLRTIIKEELKQLTESTKTIKHKTSNGMLYIEIEEDSAGVFIDVKFNKDLLTTTDIEFPSGNVNIKQRLNHITLLNPHKIRSK